MTSMCKDSMVDSCKDSNAIKGKDAQEQKPTIDQTSPFNKRAEPLLLYGRNSKKPRGPSMYAGAASPFDRPVVPLKPAVEVWPIEGGDGEAVATNDERGTDLKQQGLDAEACFMKRTFGHAKAGCTREMSCEHELLT
jgi:hypothetical protein